MVDRMIEIEPGDNIYITVDSLLVEVKCADEGVVVDICPADDPEEVLGSTWVIYTEGDEEE
jgi:hypothetical protein